jgi:hypothetical protein
VKELEMILATVATLGAAGKDAFVMWLVFDKLVPALCLLVALFFAGFVAMRIAASVSVGGRLRDAMGVGREGYLTDEEVRAMFAWVATRRSDTPPR